MLSLVNLCKVVIGPALEVFPHRMSTLAAEQLLLGTALVESGLLYLRQGKTRVDDAEGVALGLWQMEPATHDDIWTHFLSAHAELAGQVCPTGRPPAERLCTDLLYACRMARLHDYRVTDPLPPTNDADAMARYWKQYYNTPKGKGRVSTFVRLFTAHVIGPSTAPKRRSNVPPG
jgi:hypothetical protein